MPAPSSPAAPDPGPDTFDLREQRRLAQGARARRSVLEQWAEVRGVTGGIRAPHRDVAVATADGVPIAASLLPGPRRDAPAVVLGHGLAAHRHKPAYALLADILASRLHVLAIDHRGHGDSGGVCTFGREERHDVAAAVGWLHTRGYRTVVPFGCSMGGIAVMHALATGTSAAGAVLVSVPARHQRDGSTGMQELDAVLATGWKRRGWQLLAGFRIEPPDQWNLPAEPVDMVRAIESPVLVVHGEDDAYFPASEAPDLVAAAAGPATLWREPAGFGHAEDGFVPGWAAAAAAAVEQVAIGGTFPPRPGTGVRGPRGVIRQAS